MDGILAFTFIYLIYIVYSTRSLIPEYFGPKFVFYIVNGRGPVLVEEDFSVEKANVNKISKKYLSFASSSEIRLNMSPYICSKYLLNESQNIWS